ncbi:MAG TPA: DMT family transporter [Gaiellales bacterium]|nr:DMT family transporter [Gaiellales bacterium]
MTVALSLIAAVAWTMANYWLVPLSRTVDPYVASLVMLAGNGICTIPLALALDGLPGSGQRGPLGYAVLAGVLEVAGFLFFFRALQTGDLAVVAPIIGLEGGIAALAVFAFGERVGALVVLGLAIALLGGCLAASDGRGTAAGALPAAGAAVCFGAMFALYAAAEDLGPVSVVAGGRLSALALLTALVLWRGARLAPRRVTTWLLALGALDAIAFVCFSYAASRGPVSVAAVVAGQFSTLSAVVGIVLLRERLRPHQYVGIALAAVGTALLALAQ